MLALSKWKRLSAVDVALNELTVYAAKAKCVQNLHKQSENQVRFATLWLNGYMDVPKAILC